MQAEDLFDLVRWKRRIPRPVGEDPFDLVKKVEAPNGRFKLPTEVVRVGGVSAEESKGIHENRDIFRSRFRDLAKYCVLKG